LIGMLQGYEIPAAAWESAILPLRMSRYDPAWLDQLCLSGELAWARLFLPAESDTRRSGANRASPITLVFRDEMQQWMALASAAAPRPANGNGHAHFDGDGAGAAGLSSSASAVLDYLRQRGACFFQELVHGTGLLRTEVESSLRELIAHGYVTADG